LLANYNKKLKIEAEEKIFRIPTTLQPDQKEPNFEKKVL
jgi:hypothetical protein